MEIWSAPQSKLRGPYPGNCTVDAMAKRKRSPTKLCLWQVLGLLVPVSCTCYHASTSGLSTRWSSRGPYSIKDGRSHLEASFPLRCFQRVSLPNVANQQCSWRNNWHTRGSSAPVLSY